MANQQASATSAAKPAPQCRQSRRRLPEARVFRVVAQFAVGESQLGVERWAALSAGKLIKALQPCSTPLVRIAKTRGTSGAGPKAALDLGVVRQRLDLKPSVSDCRKPPNELGMNPIGRRRLRTQRRRRRLRLWCCRHCWRSNFTGACRNQQHHGNPNRNRGAGLSLVHKAA
jgi:hypothetical protein